MASGNTIDDKQIQQLISSVKSVLKGSDPVLSLMDKRVRDLFKNACNFEAKADSIGHGAPRSMRTGIQRKVPSQGDDFDSQKSQFRNELTQKAAKLGFNVVVDGLVETSYEAFKVIDHCMKVHEQGVFVPIVNELLAVSKGGKVE